MVPNATQISRCKVPFYNNLYKLWQSHSLGYSTQNFWMTYIMQLSIQVSKYQCMYLPALGPNIYKGHQNRQYMVYRNLPKLQGNTDIFLRVSSYSYCSDNLCCVEVYRTAQLASYRNIVLSYKLSSITHFTLDTHGPDTTPLLTEFVIKAISKHRCHGASAIYCVSSTARHLVTV